MFREYWKGLYRGECTDICAYYFTTPIPNYTPLGTPLGIQNFTHRHTATRRATKEDVLIIITAVAMAALPPPPPPNPPAPAHKGQFDGTFSQLEKKLKLKVFQPQLKISAKIISNLTRVKTSTKFYRPSMSPMSGDKFSFSKLLARTIQKIQRKQNRFASESCQDFPTITQLSFCHP